MIYVCANRKVQDGPHLLQWQPVGREVDEAREESEFPSFLYMLLVFFVIVISIYNLS